MTSFTTLLDRVQAHWPLFASLSLVRTSDMLPTWALSAAQQIALQLTPREIVVCRAQLPRLASQLAALHRRWIVTTVLAVLLALAVLAAAQTTPLDNSHLAVLIGVLSAILLPPLAICNGIARDYVAARALASVLNGVARE